MYFNTLTSWSDIAVLQDDLKEPYNFDSLGMDEGLVRFLKVVLSHPRKGRSIDRVELPFGVVATEKQLLTVLRGVYSGNMPEY